MNEKTLEGQIFTVSEAFDNKVYEIAKLLQTDPNYIFAHFYSESGCNPRAHVNYSDGKWTYGLTDVASIGRATKGGGLFGLMRQFCKPPIYSGSFEQFMLDSAVNQIEAFYQMVKRYTGKIHSFADVRMIGFAPKFLNATDATVMFIDKPGNADAYSANYMLDTNKNGSIEAGEVRVKWVNRWNKWVEATVKSGKPKQLKAI